MFGNVFNLIFVPMCFEIQLPLASVDDMYTLGDLLHESFEPYRRYKACCQRCIKSWVDIRFISQGICIFKKLPLNLRERCTSRLELLAQQQD